MIKHMAIKAGLGVGLMAASLGASADLHSFGKSSVYYKVNGAAVNYTAFIPSGPTSTDTVILLDVFQSGTISTWAYGIGGALGTLKDSTMIGTVSTGAGSTSDFYHGFTGTAGGLAWKASNLSYVQANGLTSTVATSSWYQGDTQDLKLSFTQVATISSQACNMTFSAELNTDDYLVFTSVAVLPSNYPVANDVVTYRTKVGTVGSDVATMNSTAFNNMSTLGSATSSFYTFTNWSIPVAGNATATYAASSVTAINKCVGAYNNRTANNSAGNIIGGKGGMMRLW